MNSALTTQPEDELEKQVDKVLADCVKDCADCVLMLDSDEYAGKEAYKYRKQMMSVIRSHDTARDQALLEELPAKSLNYRKLYKTDKEYYATLGFNAAIDQMKSLLTSRLGKQ